MGVALGVLSGAPLGGLISDQAGVIVPYLLIAGVAVVSIMLFYLVGPFPPPPPAESAEGVGILYRDSYVAICAGSVVLANLAVALTEPLVPLYVLEEPFNYDATKQGLVIGFTTLGYLIATPVAGAVGDKVAPWLLMAGGLATVGIGMIIMALDKVLWLLALGLSLLGVGIGFVDTPVLRMLAEVVEWRGISTFGSAFAIVDMSTCLGFLLGPLVASLFEAGNASLEGATVSVGIVCAVCSPSLLLLWRVGSDTCLETSGITADIPLASSYGSLSGPTGE